VRAATGHRGIRRSGVEAHAEGWSAARVLRAGEAFYFAWVIFEILCLDPAATSRTHEIVGVSHLRPIACDNFVML